MSGSLEFAKEEYQIARSKLREIFLKKMMSLQGKQSVVTTHEKTTVKGEFKGFDVDFQEMLFDNLETPSGIVSHSIMRANDIISIDFITENENSS